MIKLLLCVVSAALLAAVVLQLRQQRLELTYESAELHDEIRGLQSKLWNQQLQIAACTAPNAIELTVQTQGIRLVAEPAQTASLSVHPDAPRPGTDAPRPTTDARPLRAGRRVANRRP